MHERPIVRHMDVRRVVFISFWVVALRSTANPSPSFGQVGWMQMEPESTQGKGDQAPPAGAPENLCDQETKRLRMTQEADETIP